MQIRLRHLLLLLAVLLCLVDHADANRSYYTWFRRRCCNQPERKMCREALVRWRYCNDAARRGGLPPVLCIVTKWWWERAHQACRPGIEGPSDWVDPDKPVLPKTEY